jgi:hypothetical protein
MGVNGAKIRGSGCQITNQFFDFIRKQALDPKN